MRAHWRHLANTIEFVLPLANPSPQPKRLIDRFSHFCTTHGKVLSGMPGHVLSPSNCPFAWGIWAPSNTCFLRPIHLLRSSLGPPDSASKRHLDRFSRFWANVCKTVRPILSDRCLPVLPVTFVYCGQTVGCIRMPPGMEVGIGPCHIVLDGDLAFPHGKEHSSPTPLSQFTGPYKPRPMSILAKWLDGSGCHLVRW